MVLLHGFIFSFPLQLLFLISVTSASGNENFLTSKHFLEFVQRFSACNVVKNILELFEANAVFENRTNALNISHVCYHDLEFTARALANGERWALQSKYNMSHVTRKPVFGVCDQVRLKPGSPADILDLARIGFILSK